MRLLGGYIRKQKSLISLIVVGFLVASFTYPARAVISSCTASVDRHTITPATTADFQFTLTNNDGSNSFRWIRITRPSTNFNLNSGSSSGWSNTTGPTESIFTSGALGPGSSDMFSVNATTENVQAPPANWTVQVSDDPNGVNPTNCTGSLDTEISGSAPDATPPTITDVTLSSLTATSVKISWTTDESATSQVFYGETIDYGNQTTLDSTPKSSHQVTLTDLTPDTGYHYYIESADPAGNSAQSGDNTFLTPIQTATPPAAPAPPPSPISVASPAQPSPSTVPIKETPTETTTPIITLSTVLSNSYKETPTISGSASDNEAVARIEYSTDGGANWSLVTNVKGIGTKKVTFDFLPPNLTDGNYQVVTRAIDTSGNAATSNVLDLIIDRLPPLIGGNIISVGPQIFQPDENGIITTMAGVDQKITLAAIGGATGITLSAQLPKQQAQLFTLTQSPTSGLWSGILSFQNPGTYTIKATSTDGAGNVEERSLNTIVVLERGQVVNDEQGVGGATLTLFYQDPTTATWAPWDGASYGQKNPQKTGEEGQFRFVVPPGKYYLKAQGAGFRSVVSDILTLDQTTPLATTITMTKRPGFDLGAWDLRLPWFAESVPLQVKKAANPNDLAKNALLDKEAPAFNLPRTDGQPLETIDLRGKPTVLTFLTSWSPSFAEQIPILEELQQDEDLNVYPVMVMDNPAKISVLAAVSGYDLNFLVDPDGTTVESYGIHSLPTHIFVSRKGVIKKVVSGVLSKEVIETNLAGL